MISCTVKLILTPRQQRRASRWLWHLTGVFNWAVRKIEQDAKGGIYYTAFDLKAFLNGHSKRLDIPVNVLGETAATAHLAWRDCFSGLRSRPKLKGRRNKLNSYVHREQGITISGRRIAGLHKSPSIKFHRQDIPEGKIKRLRVVRRSSGWYGVLTIEADPTPVSAGTGQVGIDPGFSSLLTLSTGEKIERGAELERSASRLAQAQRGRRIRLTARIQERIGRQRRDRNHKLSRRLVSENSLIAWSKDRTANIARAFGKSVASSSHYQLLEMLRYKSRLGGTQLIEVPSRNSTRQCSACRALTGPTGWRGLSVRQWVCPTCGVEHDRDINAAINTLKTGLGISHESSGDAASGIAI